MIGKVQSGCMASGTERPSEIIDLGSPSAGSEDGEYDAWHDDNDDNDDDDNLSFSTSRNNNGSGEKTATGVQFASPSTDPSKPAASEHSGKKFNMALFRQKAAQKQKERASSHVQSSAEADTTTAQVTHAEAGPAETTPAMTTSTSPSSDPPSQAPSLYHLAPLEREQMKDYSHRFYRVLPRCLRFPDRWYADAGKFGSSRNGIHLVMETSWGEQKHGADRCKRCARMGTE